MKSTKSNHSLNCVKTRVTNKPLFIHKNTLLRIFSGYAISQHPFHRPPGLFDSAENFADCVLSAGKYHLEVVKISPDKLRKVVRNFCRLHPIVVKWNKPRKGKHTHVFVSRYAHPLPEYDFIDLDALAQNVYRDLIREDN